MRASGVIRKDKREEGQCCSSGAPVKRPDGVVPVPDPVEDRIGRLLRRVAKTGKDYKVLKAL